MAKKRTATSLEAKHTQFRPPIITIMGHVDHGKTTLLDFIRKTHVVEREHGGITQHIGAYQVDISGKKLTFIDTPGHAAFTAMRARGTRITDIVVLVVSAAEGVKPQTVEAIKLAKDAGVPMVVAVTKIDLPTADVERVKKELAEHEVFVEGYGGDVVCVPLSAKTGKGVDSLLEMLSLVWEMGGEAGKPDAPLTVTVIESHIDKARGPVATVIVREGTLHVGDEVVFGDAPGKVKALINDKGERVKSAGPSTPVEILGLKSVPSIGESFSMGAAEKVTLENLAAFLGQTTERKYKIILKADTMGVMEAIAHSLPPNVELLSTSTGDITDSDVLLARNADKLIIGFNVSAAVSVLKLAETEKVKIKLYRIIYELLQDLEKIAIEGLTPEATEIVTGKATIIAEFPHKGIRIAGCKVIEGALRKGDRVRIMRGEKVVGEAKLKSIRHQKNDISKADMGLECGVLFDSKIDFLTGDDIISYRNV